MNISVDDADRLIIVDWGTTSLRASLVDDTGTIFDQIEVQRGIQFIAPGEFENELLATLGHWLKDFGALTIIAFGMITSRNGWVEVPYVACPAGVGNLAAGSSQLTLGNGSALILLPGVTDTSCVPFADVMRGEETQIVGFGLRETATVVLPGTHSKWAHIAGGKVDGFQTFVTGEIFALLSQHSFIAKAAPGSSSTVNWTAFDRGVAASNLGEPGKNPLLTLLFSARTGMLANQLETSDVRDYVSGLLIGYEFFEARNCSWFKSGDTIGIVGNDGLNARYGRAARALDLSVDDGGTDAATLGALEIFRYIKAHQNVSA